MKKSVFLLLVIACTFWLPGSQSAFGAKSAPESVASCADDGQLPKKQRRLGPDCFTVEFGLKVFQSFNANNSI